MNAAQDKIEGGIEGILKEQKRLYRTLNDMARDNDNLLDVLAPMMQLTQQDPIKAAQEQSMTDDLALRAVEAAQRIINEYVDLGFVTDVVRDEGGYLGFSYDPERFARMTAESSADAA